MTLPPDDRMAELRSLFFESAEELVQKLNEEALCLEKSPGDPETSRSLRRTVHTLKGDAAACNYRELSELAHAFEDVLALDNPAAARAIPEFALRAADLFAALLQAYRGNTKLPDIQPLRDESEPGWHAARLSQPPPRGHTRKPERTTRASAIRWTEYEQLAIGTRARRRQKRALRSRAARRAVWHADRRTPDAAICSRLIRRGSRPLSRRGVPHDTRPDQSRPWHRLNPLDADSGQMHDSDDFEKGQSRARPQGCHAPHGCSRKPRSVAGTREPEAPPPHPGAEGSNAQPIAATPVPVPAVREHSAGGCRAHRQRAQFGRRVDPCQVNAAASGD